MDYISVTQTAERWCLSPRRVQKLCAENRIPGVERLGRAWLVPKDAVKSGDPRKRPQSAQ